MGGTKSLWKERSVEFWNFFCPFCKEKRQVPFRAKVIGPKQIGQILITGAFSTLLTWKWLEWKGIIATLPVWIIYETLYRTRVRAALGCPHCGFDPYLYLTDVKRARSEMESYWRGKFAEHGVEYPEKNSPPPTAQN